MPIERRVYPSDHGRDLLVVTVECSACGARHGDDYASFAKHLSDHKPEDFGLAPLGEIRGTDGSTEVIAVAE